MEEVEKIIDEILEKGFLMSLATVDESGPWVSEVVYVHGGEFEIYWWSLENTRHSQAIGKNQKVAAVITLTHSQGQEDMGLQLEGVAREASGDFEEIIKKHAIKRKKPVPEKEEVGMTHGKWYKFTPSKIDVVYEPMWGWNKKEWRR